MVIGGLHGLIPIDHDLDNSEKIRTKLFSPFKKCFGFWYCYERCYLLGYTGDKFEYYILIQIHEAYDTRKIFFRFHTNVFYEK